MLLLSYLHFVDVLMVWNKWLDIPFTIGGSDWKIDQLVHGPICWLDSNLWVNIDPLSNKYFTINHIMQDTNT